MRAEILNPLKPLSVWHCARAGPDYSSILKLIVALVYGPPVAEVAAVTRM